MPGRDGTGPLGGGRMTGGGWGRCAGNPQPGLGRRAGAGSGRGRGFGGAFGGGGRRGWRNEFVRTGIPGWDRGRWAGGSAGTLDPSEEKSVLNDEAAALQAELDRVKTRLGQIDGPQRQD